MTLAHDSLVALVAMPAPMPPTVRETRHLTLVDPTPRYVQGHLALTYTMPNGLAVVPEGSEDDSACSADAAPDPKPWAARYLQAVVEVLGQQRPVSQLARWTAADVYGELVRRLRAADATQTRQGRSRPARRSVVSVHVCTVTPDGAEVAARIVEGSRSRAVAARLDFRRGRWTCTALAVG
jgi:hypothetical protein